MRTLRDQVREKYKEAELKRDMARIKRDKASEAWYQGLMDGYAKLYRNISNNS